MGIVGFSMGGHIAYLAATQFDFAATACLYGGWITNTEIELSRPEPTVSLTKGIAEHNGKLIYFAGGLDTHITKDQLDLMETKLKEEQVRYELVEYPNCSHGFFCDQRPADYNAKAHDDSVETAKRTIKRRTQGIATPKTTYIKHSVSLCYHKGSRNFGKSPKSYIDKMQKIK